jgi:Cutinase
MTDMKSSTRLLLASLAVITVSATTALALPVQASTSRRHQPACADLLFLGARGSSEPGPGTKGWKPTKRDPYGLGRPVNSFYSDLTGQLAAQRTITVISLRYAATSALTLATDRKLYFKNLDNAISAAIGDLKTQATACPGQDIMLAGFSQGAIVMHRVLHELASKPADAGIVSRLAAAILIGDGDQVPADNEVRFGTAPLKAHGVGQAFPKVSGASAAKFGSATGAGIASVCDKADLVCDWTDWDEEPVAFAYAFSVHLQYPNSKPVSAAASWAAKRVLALPVP